jgi:hypothetical protein
MSVMWQLPDKCRPVGLPRRGRDSKDFSSNKSGVEADVLQKAP